MEDAESQGYSDQWDKIQDHKQLFTNGVENDIAARYPLGGYLRGILQEGLSVSSAPGNVMAKPRVQSDST